MWLCAGSQADTAMIVLWESYLVDHARTEALLECKDSFLAPESAHMRVALISVIGMQLIYLNEPDEAIHESFVVFVLCTCKRDAYIGKDAANCIRITGLC